jgi:hypothetical protein
MRQRSKVEEMLRPVARSPARSTCPTRSAWCATERRGSGQLHGRPGAPRASSSEERFGAVVLGRSRIVKVEHSAKRSSARCASCSPLPVSMANTRTRPPTDVSTCANASSAVAVGGGETLALRTHPVANMAPAPHSAALRCICGPTSCGWAIDHRAESYRGFARQAVVIARDDARHRRDPSYGRHRRAEPCR